MLFDIFLINFFNHERDYIMNDNNKLIDIRIEELTTESQGYLDLINLEPNKIHGAIDKDGKYCSIIHEQKGDMHKIYILPLKENGMDKKTLGLTIENDYTGYTSCRKPLIKDQQDYLINTANILRANGIITIEQHRTIEGTIRSKCMDMEAISNFFNKRDENIMKSFDKFCTEDHAFITYRKQFILSDIKEMQTRMEIKR